jgi:predicted nucleic acid-binding protein
VREFLDEVHIMELVSEIKVLTAKIRKVHGTKLPDAMIAATALHHNIELITRNTKDFNKIESLKITNPFEETPF